MLGCFSLYFIFSLLGLLNSTHICLLVLNLLLAVHPRQLNLLALLLLLVFVGDFVLCLPLGLKIWLQLVAAYSRHLDFDLRKVEVIIL